MKKILIIGKNSYIGKSLENWLRIYPDKYYLDTISLRNDNWKQKDFSKYDVVFHAAGIAHIKETEANADLYYKVNRDLTFQVAKKAKFEGVKQFIFLSSMSVYGIEKGVIDSKSPLTPNSNYGKSKLQAEELIKSLEDDINFKVAILRPPMIYGKGCKGNYPRLAKLAVKIPFFPDIDNKRSMIYIDNLSEYVRLIIDNCESGLFFPQNNEYVNTTNMVKLVAHAHGKKIRTIKLFNFLIKIINNSTLNKVFGDLIYEKNLSKSKIKCDSFISIEESINLTED